MLYLNKHQLKCPTCNSPMKPATAISGSESTFWMKCTNKHCKTFVDTYLPTPSQEQIHQDPHRFIGVFGGYGSGKTASSLKDDEKHMLSTPNGTTVVGSAVLAQVEQTYEKDFINDMPIDFLRSQNKQKKMYTLINGHIVLIKSYYEENLLRSLNVSRYHIVEASEVDHEIDVQLKTRLRHQAGTLPELDEFGTPIFETDSQGKSNIKLKADWRKGIIESNPSAGWIREDFLMHSDQINTHGLTQNYVPTNIDKNISSHIIGTKSNPYLPPNFYAEQAKNKPRWWIERYLNGSFDYAEGMVYPNVLQSICKPFAIPNHWKRVIGLDYGIRDQTAIIFIAIDPREGVAYVFDEVYINNVNYQVIAKHYKDHYAKNVPPGSLLNCPVMDARSINKRNDFDLRTIGELFEEEGIFFEPAQMDLNTRILRVNTLIEAGQLRIFNTCTNLCTEIMKYKFPERTSTGKSTSDKPEDKNNHAINAMEFAVMELPMNLTETSHIGYTGRGAIKTDRTIRKEKSVPSYDPFSTKQVSRDYGDFGQLFTNYREEDLI